VFHVKPKHLALALTITSSGLLAAPAARAQDAPSHPQFNAGVVAGVAGVGEGGQLWEKTKFHLGLRGDVLFGRSSPWDWGFGPMVNASTNGFSDVNLATGVSALAPVQEYLPLVFSLGPHFRHVDTWEPGAFASVFWGSRSFNYHGLYGLAGGLLLEGRAGFGDSKERTIIIAAHLDLEVIALPVVFLINAFR
jgi:hypothetical protein